LGDICGLESALSCDIANTCGQIPVDCILLVIVVIALVNNIFTVAISYTTAATKPLMSSNQLIPSRAN